MVGLASPLPVKYKVFVVMMESHVNDCMTEFSPCHCARPIIFLAFCLSKVCQP